MDLLTEWKSNWFCYWDGSYATPANQEIHYVFKPPLEIDEFSGFVKFGLDDNEYVQQAIEVLSDLNKLIDEAGVMSGCLGSESEYPFTPFLYTSWAPEKPLTPQALLESIGAHSELLTSISYDPTLIDRQLKGNSVATADAVDSAETDDDGSKIFGELNSYVFEKLAGESRDGVLIFYCGSDKLNPIPLFIVCKFSPTVIGGFLSAIVHT
jgi:hypothetical protein